MGLFFLKSSHTIELKIVPVVATQPDAFVSAGTG